MENEILPAESARNEGDGSNPFTKTLALPEGLNFGSVAIESQRAIAEAQGELTLAKKFPRSVSKAITEFMEACANIDFAAVAFYAVKNRGSGPSIRFAEECARCYGNFDYGHKELSRTSEKSEVEVYAWDKEKNNRSRRQITVEHIMDTKDGPIVLRTQSDIDNRIANVAAKQMRGRILALMPKHMVAAGIAACKRTIAGGGDKPVAERINAMAVAFAKFGVNNDMLARYLNHSVDDTTIDELADMLGIFNSIKDGTSKASDHFTADNSLDKPQSAAAAAISAASKKGAEKKDSAATPAPAASTTPSPKAGPKVNKTPAPAPAPVPSPEPAPEPQADMIGDAQEEDEPPQQPASESGTDDVF